MSNRTGYGFAIGERVVTPDHGPATVTHRFQPILNEKVPAYFVTIDGPAPFPLERLRYTEIELRSCEAPNA